MLFVVFQLASLMPVSSVQVTVSKETRSFEIAVVIFI